MVLQLTIILLIISALLLFVAYRLLMPLWQRVEKVCDDHDRQAEEKRLREEKEAAERARAKQEVDGYFGDSQESDNQS